MHVTVYTKPGCNVCEEVLATIERLAPEYGLEVSEVNILSDKALYGAHSSVVPVVEIGGSNLARLTAPITEADLRSVLDIVRHAFPVGPSILQPARELLLDRVVRYIGAHWLRLANISLAVFVGLPWLAPVFAALGWWGLADPIYTAYALT